MADHHVEISLPLKVDLELTNDGKINAIYLEAAGMSQKIHDLTNIYYRIADNGEKLVRYYRSLTRSYRKLANEKLSLNKRVIDLENDVKKLQAVMNLSLMTDSSNGS